MQLDWPASNDSFLSESEAIRNSLAVNEETCRSQNKEGTGCAGAELQNSRGRTESSGRCHKSEHSSRTEALKLLNRGQTSKSADIWDNHGFSLSEETQVEDTGRCRDGREDSDCTGRSQEESESSGQSQARTGNSETQEESKTSDSDTSKSPSVHVQATDLTQTPGDQEDPTAICQFTRSWAEQTSLKRAYSFVTESVTDFIFPHTRSRPPLIPAMPTLPEEEEDSPEELNSTSSSPSTYAPVESMMVSVTMTPPAIVLPRQVSKQEPCPLEKARPHSPRPRLSRNSASSCPITTVDDDGHVIDLVKDQLPELQLSEEDRQKNLELLEEAKKVSDHFLQRRGRRSTCSLSESPTALSLNPTPCSSPRPSRSSSLSSPSQLGPEVTTTPPASPSIAKHLEVPSTHDQGDTSKPEQETFTRLVDWMPSDKRKVSSGPLTVRYSTAVPARDPAVVQKEKPDHHGPADKGKNSEHAAQKKEETSGCGITGVAKPVPRPTTQQAPCTAEIKTIGAFPPLMRAVSWDTVGSINMRNAAPKGEDSLSDKSRESLFKSSGYKDFPVPPGNVQKLSKLREEHKLMRNQSISSPKLPDLSETTEQERGPSSSLTSSPSEEEAKEKPDAMPNISDVMLRKLKLHRGLRGCAPPLSEKEVENAFVQLSLAFRNDNYTLESRLKQAERERNLTEENAEKELEEFKITLKNTVSLWQNIEQREFYQHLLETIAVLYRLTNRLSSRAEMVGAVRQEKRMNKATEVMMQYVENLKRTYEKDHAELMEFKKVASQNSSRCYAGSVDTGEDGVPRTSRSMSVQMGKALPRRRVSVAVVPKFNLLNIPGQTPASAGPNAGPLPVVCEANTIKNSSSSDPTQQDVPDKSSGNPLTEQESEATPTKVVCSPEKITEEIKAKIEEEAYNKGYQEGLKRSKELQELKEEEENAEEKPKDSEEEARGNTDKDRKTNSRFEEALEVFDRIFPKFFRGNRVLWIVLTLFFASFILVNVISFFSNRYSESGDTSAEKSAVPGKKFFGLNVGSKTPAPE
ncbi:protein MRVI1 isoform X1 [Sinocyclocheilus anshuiensis]|uniref:protein MRVI1 isoform X1 n=2 Tax=Sinocyclocheilus anshuiensis TaxID=1608454 RepID=UPI0007B89A39|nr:PREDICTED: protein MRVI1-like isoform X1 [Sinocyclocheilus anshuiensis]